jgi:serine/threonine protein kinase
LEWLTALRGMPGVPVLQGTCHDQDGRLCIITSPVGQSLNWELWDSSSSRKPLHGLLPALVRSLQQLHGTVVIRDLRPANLVLTADMQLLIVDLGSAIKVDAGSAAYSGTVHYASDSVLHQLQQGKQVAAKVEPADDLVSLVRGMFAIRHPAIAVQLRRKPEAELQDFWGKVMGTHSAWQDAETAAKAACYDQVAALLERLMQ